MGLFLCEIPVGSSRHEYVVICPYFASKVAWIPFGFRSVLNHHFFRFFQPVSLHHLPLWVLIHPSKKTLLCVSVGLCNLNVFICCVMQQFCCSSNSQMLSAPVRLKYSWAARAMLVLAWILPINTLTALLKWFFKKGKEMHSYLKDPDVQYNICRNWMLFWISSVFFSWWLCTFTLPFSGVTKHTSKLLWCRQ